jgi:hypothetical protein
MLVVIGLAQSFAMVTMAVTLLVAVPQQFRARVMGVRMLAVYGLPLGLVASSFFVEGIGFPGTVAVYSAFGIAVTLAIAIKWRQAIWQA